MTTRNTDDSSADDWPAFLQGGGVTGALVRSLDWSQTPVGPIDQWPISLKSIVGVLLHSRHPMFLWWGNELIQFYNDAYLPSFGEGKHPAAMGRPGRETWREIWPTIGPQIEAVMRHARPSWSEDALVPIWRNGRIEEVYWTYGYSPVYDEHNAVAGTLVVCTETTARMLAERRLRTLRNLDECTSLATDLVELRRLIEQALTEAATDIPFVLLSECAQGTGRPVLKGLVGLGSDAAERLTAQLEKTLERASTPQETVTRELREHSVVSIEAITPLHQRWPEPVTRAFVVPRMHASKATHSSMIFGLSPRLPFDAVYRNHLLQLAEHLELAERRIEASRARASAVYERNTLLLQAPVAAALLTGPEHVFELANLRFAEMVGGRELVGRPHRRAFPELDDTALPGILDDVHRTGQPFVTEEMRLQLDRDGRGQLEERFFRFNLEPLRDGAGAVYGMMVVAVDLSEQVSARRTLQKAHDERLELLEELEAASSAKDEFLAMLGHELRNPLSPIVTALRLLKLQGDHKTDRAQKVIERQVSHLVRLVDDLLDVSKITRGKVELRKERCAIRDVIMNALEIASVLFEERRHELDLDISDEDMYVEGDRVRLAQAVTNLLTNAARYTPAGGHIRVAASRDDADIVIRVRDDGIGIASDMLPLVFNLFVQGKRSADRAEGGLGLGLSLAKNLVALHGGSIHASSPGLDHGSEFMIRLPALRSEMPEPPRTREASVAAGQTRSKRVLIVDDNVDAADLLGEVLRNAGHEATVVHDPSLALQSIEQCRPEVAVLDIGLPVMDGYELAAQLRATKATADCRLIALTGYGQDQDRQRSSEAGFNHHMVKPVDLNVLLQLLATFD